MLRDRDQQQRMPNDSCNDNDVGAEPEQRGAKAMRVPRYNGSLKSSDVNVNGVSSSNGASSGISSSNSSNDSSRDVDVYQSRNRMVAAGKRRRWTDVRGASTQDVLVS